MSSLYLPDERGSRDGYQLESFPRRPVGYRRDGSPIEPIGGASFITGTSVELIYANTAAGTAKASFTSEFASLNDTAGMGALAHLPVDFWASPADVGRGIRIQARGILSSTATPSYTFTIRLGAAASTTAAIIAGTAALVTGSGVTNQSWALDADVVLATLGAAGANSTVRGTGMFFSGGLASPFMYLCNAAASATAPTVATVDTSIVNFFNVNITSTALSASNSVQLLQLLVFGLN